MHILRKMDKKTTGLRDNPLFYPKAETINHFEGPEKKLEIILRKPLPRIRRRYGRTWERVVEAGGAKVISKISNADMDAYLLSESSLFVWDDRFIMITCGKTTLVKALPEILNIVDKNDVAMFFYQRKNQMFPSAQPLSFANDVALLETFFPGKTRRMGPVNQDHAHVFFSPGSFLDHDRGVTLELLMHEFDPCLIRIFSRGKANTASLAEKRSGISRLYPEMRRDGFLFSPRGYSLNAISGPKYFTIHVTPQRRGSYASFETNLVEKSYRGLIIEMVEIFKPRKFSLVLTTGVDKKASWHHKAANENPIGYELTEKSHYEFECGLAATILNLVKSQ